MGYVVFLSHSMGEADRQIVEGTVEHARRQGVELYIADRDPRYGQSLTDKIKARIRGCDCLVVLWTKHGADSQWVNREVGIALQANKLVIPVVEKGVETKGLFGDIEYVRLDRDNSDAAIAQLTGYLAGLKTKKDMQQAIVAGVLLVVLIVAISRN